MVEADLDTVRDLVFSIVRDSPLGERLTDVRIEVAPNAFGGDFLRVILALGPLREADHAQAIALMEAIEERVQEIDPRFPNVRFAKAA